MACGCARRREKIKAWAKKQADKVLKRGKHGKDTVPTEQPQAQGSDPQPEQAGPGDSLGN